MLASILFLLGCPPEAKDSVTDTDPDPDTAADTATDTAVEPFVLGAVERFEGFADLSGNVWAGEEALVSRSADGATEYCRAANPTQGVVSDLRCTGCEFHFDVEVLPGTITGEWCENVRITTDLWAGDAWTYAFSQFYVYEGEYWSDVMLFAYEVDDAVYWRPFGYGELASTRDSIIYWTFDLASYYYGP